MKIISIVGARPQFIKLAPIIKAINDFNSPITHHLIIHTGQHYDYEMSQVFFDELGLKDPDYHLGVGSGTHGYQTAEMIKRIEEVLLKEKPDVVLVYGDTNSTLAGALAATKLKCSSNSPILCHIEAGLRSFNKKMPEEINRILTDHCSDILFCPTETAVNNLCKEGFTNVVNNGKLIKDSFNPSPFTSYSSPLVINVGDIMYEAVLLYLKVARKKSNILERLKLTNRNYYLATLHRAENTDSPKRLKNIIEALIEISKEKAIIFPVHPRARKVIEVNYPSLFTHHPSPVTLHPSPFTHHPSLVFIEPVSYFDMLVLEAHTQLIFTDSGGVQKEAFFLKVPCITLRNETEWIETVESGWNILAGADKEKILSAEELMAERLAMARNSSSLHNSPFTIHNFYGDGHTSKKIIEILLQIQKNAKTDTN